MAKSANNGLISGLFMDEEPGDDEWLSIKVTGTLQRVADKSTPTYAHADVMASLMARVAAKRARKRA